MNITAFASYIFLTAYTPGPNNIMAMTNSAKFGLKASFKFCLGMMTGFAIDMLLCAVFTTLLFSYIPAIEPFMKWVGAAYILFLAYTIFRDKPHKNGKESRLRPNSFLTGMLMQFVNVKVILYGITAMSTFVLPHYSSMSAVIVAVLVLNLVGFSANLCWMLFGSLFQRLFESHRKLLNAVMALTLVYCAVSSLLS